MNILDSDIENLEDERKFLNITDRLYEFLGLSADKKIFNMESQMWKSQQESIL